MDSIGPAPTGPLPEALDLSDDDVEQLLQGLGGPPAWFEVAELLDRIRMEAAVEPDDLWVRTHVAVAAAAVRRTNLVPDPTAGRPSRPLRLGAVAAATTTLIATMGLAAADTLPEPLQSVASHVAALVGMDMPDGHSRVPAPVAPEAPAEGPAAPSTTAQTAPRDRPASPGPDAPPSTEAAGDDLRVPEWFNRRPGINGRTNWLPGWGREGDRFDRRTNPGRPLSSLPSTTHRPDLPWVPSSSSDDLALLGELLERWTEDRLRPYTEPQARPGPMTPPEEDDEASIAALPPTRPRWRPPAPRATTPPAPAPTPPTTGEVGRPGPSSQPGNPLPRRPRPSGERPSFDWFSSNRQAAPDADAPAPTGDRP